MSDLSYATKGPECKIHQHRPQIAIIAHHTSNSTPRRASQTAPGRQSSTRAITSTSNSTPNSIPKQHLQQRPKLHAPCTLPSISQKAPQTAPPQTPSRTPNSIPERHLHQHPKLRAPLHPTVKMQKCACAVTCMPDSTRASKSQIAPAPSPAPQQHPKTPQHQHPKLHAPVHPTIKMQKLACTVTPHRQS